MRVLLHTCCGPCSIHPVEALKSEMEVAGYFFNPNIHPYTEWKARRDALAGYAAGIGLAMIYDDRYLLEEFIRGVVHRESERCSFCYALRLRQTAQTAREKGFDAFSSTLLVSPYQKHDLIRETGEVIAGQEGVPFLYRDFRPGYREATARSRELGLYRQKYCGCIYSEKDRYCRTRNGGITK